MLLTENSCEMWNTDWKDYQIIIQMKSDLSTPYSLSFVLYVFSFYVC